jgi:hypothetical protein
MNLENIYSLYFKNIMVLKDSSNAFIKDAFFIEYYENLGEYECYDFLGNHIGSIDKKNLRLCAPKIEGKNIKNLIFGKDINESKDFECCLNFKKYYKKGLIKYRSKHREYYIEKYDNKNISRNIKFCFWCGFEFPKSLETEWFLRIKKESNKNEKNYELFQIIKNEFYLDKYKTDQWWKIEKL